MTKSVSSLLVCFLAFVSGAGIAIFAFKRWYTHRAADVRLSETKRLSQNQELTLLQKEFETLKVNLEDQVCVRTHELMQNNLLLVQDLSQRDELLTKLRVSEERYALAVLGSQDGLWDWDLINDQIYCSEQWKAILGYAPDEIEPHTDTCHDWIHPDDINRIYRELHEYLQGTGPFFESEIRVRHRDGHYLWALCRGIALRNDQREVTRMTGFLTNISARKQAEEQLAYNALHDSLTKLPNRALFMDRLQQAVERTRRHPDYHFSVLYLDFDRFKSVNDSLGHAIGDELLIQATKRMQCCVRSEDTLARLSGDEFVILLEDTSERNAVQIIINRITQALDQPMNLSGHHVQVSASIGVVIGCIGYERYEEILRDADIAMYKAKTGGRARAVIFENIMRDHAIARLKMEMELRSALGNGELALHYQPILDLERSTITGFEALLRWNHPLHGTVYPLEFLSVAEETGLIFAIGNWVLRQACRQIKQWQQIDQCDPPLRISVNISACQLAQTDFHNELITILKESDVKPSDLQLEITENILVENHQILENLKKIRASGVKIQIDDFGTSCSPFRYLHHFPVDTVKIDRALVSQGPKSRRDQEVIRTIVHMAETLKMQVVVEGIETEQQLAQLKALGCKAAQGHLFFKAMSSDQINQILAERTHQSPVTGC